MKAQVVKLYLTGGLFFGMFFLSSLALAQEVEPEQANPRSQSRKEIRAEKRELAMAKKESLADEREEKRVRTEKGVGEVDGIRHEKGVENSTRGRENRNIDQQKIRERNENQLERRLDIRERRENAGVSRRRG